MGKMLVIVKSISVLFSICLLTSAAGAAHPSQELVVLSQAVGAVIDAAENDRFHLFSRDVGLIVAKVYKKNREQWVLHLLGEAEGTSWMLTRKISSQQRGRLKNRIAQASFQEKGNYRQFAEPVIKIKLPEKSVLESPNRVKLDDGTKLIGNIVKCTEESISFVTLSGLAMNIPDDKIVEIKWSQGRIVAGEFRNYDPNHIRLFFGPTGRTLRQGEVNFSDFYVLFPTLAVGVTDFFQIGGGISLIPGASTQLLYISPKLRFLHQDKLDMAAGLLYLGVPGEGGIGTAYTAVSLGSPLGGVTFGLGLPLNKEDLNVDVALLFGAEVQVSNKAKLITENWLFGGDSESFLLLSGGVRFIGENLTVGLGFATSPEILDESNGFPFIPWLDFSVSIGK
ncbi:MAG: hypothetical protein ACE5IR_03115 [bacterium]